MAKKLRTIANYLHLVTQLVDTNEQCETLVDKRCYIYFIWYWGFSPALKT